MKRSKTSSLAVLICTSNRRDSLQTCLKSLSAQTIFPDHLIVIEKIIDKQTISLSSLKKLFKNKVKIDYKKITEGNISVSRNIALSLVKEDIILFVDDDVILERQYLEKLLKIYEENISYESVVGKILPTRDNYWQRFSLALITSCIKDSSKEVAHWPTLNFSIKKEIIDKYSLTFDEDYSGLEDLAFCLRMASYGEKINYSSSLFVKHKFRNSMKGFIKSFSYYFKNINQLYADYPKQDIFNLFLYKRSPLRIIRLISNSFKMTKEFSLPKKFFFSFLIYHFLVFKSIDQKYLV